MKRGDPPVHERIALRDLEPHHCRFPIGTVGEATFGFCGRQKAVGPYCEDHAKRAYLNRTKARAKAIELAKLKGRWP